MLEQKIYKLAPSSLSTTHLHFIKKSTIILKKKHNLKRLYMYFFVPKYKGLEKELDFQSIMVNLHEHKGD